MAPTAPVLLGIDFSECSELATELALDEASRRGAPLVALHAWWSSGAFEFAGPECETLRAEAEEFFAERFARGRSVIRMLTCDGWWCATPGTRDHGPL